MINIAQIGLLSNSHYYAGSRFSYPAEGEDLVLTLQDTKFLENYDGSAVDNDGWFGRQSVAKRSDGVIVRTYREGSAHHVETYSVIHIKFSDDYGVTWSDQDEYLDGTPVVGFPLRPTGAGNPSGNTRGPSEGTLMLCPNGDLLCVMWSSNYDDDHDGAWQARSTDGGLTWGDLHRVEWLGDIVDNDEVFFNNGHVVVGSTIYTTVRKVFSDTPYKEEAYIATSTDNGESWTVISQVTDSVNTASGGELSLEYVGNGRFVSVFRAGGNINAYYTYSEDYCQTWATPIEISFPLGIGTTSWLGRTTMYTRAHVKGEANWWNDRLLLICGFTGGTENVSTGQRRNFVAAALIPSDYDLSAIKFYPVTYLDSVGYDGGYGDFFYNPDLDQFVFCSYRSPTSLFDASTKQYNFTLSFAAESEFLLQDFFTAGAIDTSKWAVTDPADGVTISQTGGKLRIAANPASPVASSNTNHIDSIASFPAGGVRVLRATISRNAASVKQLAVLKLYNAGDAYNTARQVQFAKLTTDLQLRIYDGSSFIYDVTTAIDWEVTGVDVKIVIEANNDIKWYYWDGSTQLWTQLGTTQNFDLGGDLKASCAANSNGTDSGSPHVEFDNIQVFTLDTVRLRPRGLLSIEHR